MKITLRVGDMMCDGCAETVSNAICKTQLVDDISVDVDKKLVEVVVGEKGGASQVERLAKVKELVEAVKAADFDAEPVF